MISLYEHGRVDVRFENFEKLVHALGYKMIFMPQEKPATTLQDVVFCKDCRHRGTSDCPMMHKIEPFKASFDSWGNDYDYCSAGVEKGADDE